MGNKEVILERARLKNNSIKEIRLKPTFVRTISTFIGVGLLAARNNHEKKVRALYMKDILLSAKVEPRILEVLPAFAYHYRILILDDKLPLYLEKFIKGEVEEFKGLNKDTCFRWINSHKPKSVARMRVNISKAPTICRIIRKARADIGLTQREFTQAFKIPFSSLEKFEKGNLNIRASVLSKLQRIATHCDDYMKP